MQRRGLLVWGSLAAAAIALPPVLRRWPSDFEFTELHGFPGFRRLSSGAMTPGIDVFSGIGAPSELPAPEPPSDPCRALFGDHAAGDTDLPVAVFSDVNCPNCRDLEARLIGLRRDGAEIRLIWHSLPLLGPASVRAARAEIAAGFQGVGEAAHLYVMQRSLRPGPGALHQMARDLELEPEKFLRDAQGERVASALRRSLALGRALGIPGTPGMVAGRTLVIGALSQHRLERLIRLERETPLTVCPAV